jgi:hypothetical protein
MISFKEFIDENSNEEIIGFCNAGGAIGQYDKLKLPTKPSIGFCNAGGKIEQYNRFDENLNPKDNTPKFINDPNTIFTDPEKSNVGLGKEEYKPEHLGIEDYHKKGFVVPENNREHAKKIKAIAPLLNRDKDYYDMMDAYTPNSYILNNILLHHSDNKTEAPNSIRANLEREHEVHLDKLDNLIEHHRTPDAMTVYTGTHLDPAQHKGKILRLPAYTSTSVNPHVAKDFGKTFSSYNHHNNQKEYVNHILRIELPKGQQHLFTDHGSHYPGQGEVILPRNTRLQVGQEPSHIVYGNFSNHADGKRIPYNDTIHYIWNARILKDKK